MRTTAKERDEVISRLLKLGISYEDACALRRISSTLMRPGAWRDPSWAQSDTGIGCAANLCQGSEHENHHPHHHRTPRHYAAQSPGRSLQRAAALPRAQVRWLERYHHQH